MRMWKVNPKILCDKHLRGEHVEMHMFVGSILKGRSLKGYVAKGLVEIHNIWKRHEELAKEMLRRDMKHESDLPKCTLCVAGSIDVDDSMRDLADRCEECRERILDYIGEQKCC